MKAAVLLLAVAGTVSCSRKGESNNDFKDLPNTVVLEWNEIAFRAFDGPAYQHSLMAARINAMTHIAMHDALNAVRAEYASYAFSGKDENADPVATAVAAAHAVLLHEIPGKKNFLDSALARSLVSVKEGEARRRGLALGKLAAQAIITVRKEDGAARDPFGTVAPSSAPGVYQVVPPFDFVFAPHWEYQPLFALSSKDQFRPAPHPALGSAEYLAAFNEVKETGKLNSGSRTEDQSAYTKFWYEFSEAGWNRVARVAATNKKLGLYETARLFALVDMALADAYTAGWDAKFHYNFWRPYTAIRAAANDGNKATEADPVWEPAEPTPPVQDYPSTHSALGNAAATVLALVLGDQTAFTMTSFTATPAGSTRSFNSFSEAADENADSRVRAGIHFRFSCEAGQDMGNKIGKWVVNTQLKPLH
jgi:hypothetical protein